MGWLGLWWSWIAIALVLGILEILLPTFLFLGFSLGALVLGALILVVPGLFASVGFTALMAIYAILSLLAWVFLRFAFRKQSSDTQIFTEDVND